ncbi:STAS domain-containing protein [Mycolicibacterium sp. XJ1819]
MPGRDPITTSVSHRDEIAVVAVGGDIDLATIPALEGALADAEARGPAVLIVDLSDVDFLASAGLQALVAAHERIGRSARFAVVADGPSTSRPIQLTGLDQVLSLYPTISDAIAAENGGSPPQN